MILTVDLFCTLFETGVFSFSLHEAINPETGDQTSKPGDSGSNPESWQP